MTRWMVFYSLVIVLLHLVLYRQVRSSSLLGNISFYGTFAYLAILRVIHFAGLPPLKFIANAIQLIMTLRVIGLSYEIVDARNAKKDVVGQQNGDAREKRFILEPNSFEAFTYLYSFTGLFTGPYYTYQTYYDSIHSPNIPNIPVGKMVKEKIWTLSWSLPLLMLLYVLNPVEILKNEQINNYSFITVMVLSALAFVYLRMRIYSAWMIAESICICSGIGLYPKDCKPEPGHGPRDIDKYKALANKENIVYSAEAIDNLDIPHVEASDGFRSGMRAWNRTVQFWLANFVYKRSNKAIRMPYTMFVSAFWHGIHPGYFLSFLTIPLCTAAEDILFKVVTADEKGKRPMWFQFIWGFIRMRGFEQMACGFLLLTWTDTIRLWSNVYWWLHITMALVILLGKAYLMFGHKKKKE
uniref:Lysophospholipid acyltransferase 7 n=1 Tax=Acrobeloides nanus TaxID=290746 RepID=A0A914DUR5_9BILA